MTQPFSGSVRTGCAVDQVEFNLQDDGSTTVTVTTEDEDKEVFDAIIFACSAPSMLTALHG